MSFRKARNFGLSLIIAILIFVGLIPTFVTFQIREHNANFLSDMQELELATRLQKIFWIASAEFHDLVDRSEGDFDSVFGKLKQAPDIGLALEKELIHEEIGEELAAIKKLQRQTKIFKAAVIQYEYEFKPSMIKIRDILENSLIMIKEKAPKHGIKLTTDHDGIPEFLIADVRKLKQIPYNLLSNAVKFAPENGRILLAARCIRNSDELVKNLSNPATNYLQISVEDNGIGLKQEDLAKIFEPFEQVECSASRQFQGTGLGLALTKSLVELHGGMIWAESEGQDLGSTFSFTLPI